MYVFIYLFIFGLFSVAVSSLNLMHNACELMAITLPLRFCFL